MSDFSPTVLQTAITKTAEMQGFAMKEQETRPSRYGALEAYAEGTDRLVPASTLTASKEAAAHLTSIDVFVKEGIGLGTVRKCSGTTSGTTAEVAVNYQGFAEEFSLSFEQHQGNRAKYQETFNHMFSERLRSLYNRIDTAAILELELQKATGGGAGSIYTTVVGEAKQVARASWDTAGDFYNNVSVEMEQNDFFGPYVNISSTSQKALQRFDAAQGGSNSTNLAFQQGDFVHKTSNRLTNGIGVVSTSYMVDPASIGMLTWNNAISRIGKDTGTDEWTSFVDPSGLLGNIELKITRGCADNSGLVAGAEADYAESFVMYVDVAFLHAYNSDDPGQSYIYKYELTDA